MKKDALLSIVLIEMMLEHQGNDDDAVHINLPGRYSTSSLERTIETQY